MIVPVDLLFVMRASSFRLVFLLIVVIHTSPLLYCIYGCTHRLEFATVLQYTLRVLYFILILITDYYGLLAFTMSFSSRTPLSSRYICTCIALMDSSRARQPIMISREVGLLSRVSGLHSSRSTVVSDAHGINLRTIDIMIHDDCPVNVNSTITTYSMSCIPIRKP